MSQISPQYVDGLELLIRELSKQLAALRLDAERLDWLETNDGRYANIDSITSIVGKGFNGHKTLRGAIDAAKEERK